MLPKYEDIIHAQWSVLRLKAIKNRQQSVYWNTADVPLRPGGPGQPGFPLGPSQPFSPVDPGGPETNSQGLM